MLVTVAYIQKEQKFKKLINYCHNTVILEKSVTLIGVLEDV